MMGVLLGIGLGRGDCDAVIKMEFAWPAVVIESVGNVGILLKFDKRNSTADRVDRTRWDNEKVTRAHWPPRHQFVDRTVERRSAQFFRAHRSLQAEPNRRSRFRFDDRPAFAFTLRQPAIARLHI